MSATFFAGPLCVCKGTQGQAGMDEEGRGRGGEHLFYDLSRLCPAPAALGPARLCCSRSSAHTPPPAQQHRRHTAGPQLLSRRCYCHAYGHAHILRQLSDNHCSITAIIVQSSSLASPSITVGSS